MFWPLGSHDKALGLSSKPKTQKHFAGGFKQRAKCAVPWTCSQGGTQSSASREERGRSRSGFQFLFYCAEAPSGRLNLCHPHSTAASPGTESEASSCCNTTSPCCSSQRVGGAGACRVCLRYGFFGVSARAEKRPGLVATRRRLSCRHLPDVGGTVPVLMSPPHGDTRPQTLQQAVGGVILFPSP